MKRSKRKRNEAFPDLSLAASASECTGILPAQIENAEEGESVAALQGIPPVRPPKEK